MDPIKVQHRQEKRNEKWLERQERSRANREEEQQLVEKLKKLKEQVDASEDGRITPEPTKFSDLPISSRTMQGLERGNYIHLTRIQSAALPAALCGRDILGAAKTGSGKTLSFLIPVLERLWMEKWDADSGVGAIVLSPTRELALQTFKVLQVIGIRHTMSAALLTGGRNVEEEKSRLHAINIIIGTPGRILHHMTESSNLSVENLLMLIFDEADRLLDMGFRETITSILEQLPQDNGRQTLLYSATQTRDVSTLGQLSMGDKKPLYISDVVGTAQAALTPSKLSHNFIVVELHKKLDLLYLFLKRHPQDKIVVFASTQNQVRFMFLAFSRLMKKSKIPLMCLTGKMKQFRREEVFMTFCRCKSAVLFCTDLAARGLDFPMVHWVVQYDCPESPQTYIHRAGRTARAGARGVSVVFLTPRETPMLSYLHHKSIPLREVAVRQDQLVDTKQMMVALAVQGLKLEAQKACIGYLRSLHFASNKDVFDLASVDTAKFAHSLGLNAVPDLSDITTGRSAKNLPWDVQNFMQALKKKNLSENAAAAVDADVNDDKNNNNNNKEGKTRRERHLEAADMFTSLQAAQRFNVKKKDYFGGDDDEEEDVFKKNNNNKNGDALFTKRRLDPTSSKNGEAGGDDDLIPLTAEERLKGLSKHKQRRLVEAADLRVKDLNLNTRIKFDEDDDDNENEGDEGEDDDDLVSQSLSKKNKQGKEEKSKWFSSVDGLDMEEAPNVDQKDAESYMKELKSRVKSAQVDDKQRFRDRKFQLLEKKGLVAPRDKKGDKNSDDDEDESDDDYDDGQSDSSDGSLDELLKAARGELYSDDDDDEDEDENENDDGDEDDDDEQEETAAVASTKNLALNGRRGFVKGGGEAANLAQKRQPAKDDRSSTKRKFE